MASAKQRRRAARKRHRYASQAALEAELQLGPQASALRALLADAAGEYQTSTRFNASTARGMRQAIRESQPRIRQFYGGEAGSPAQGSILAAAMAQARTTGRDKGQLDEFTRRISEEQGRTLADLERQGVLAEQGRRYGNLQARDEYRGAKQKILTSLNDLAAQSGKLTAARFGQLMEADVERRLKIRDQNLDLQLGQQRIAATIRGQDVTAKQRAADRRSRERVAAKNRAAKGKDKPEWMATPEGRRRAYNQVEEARRWVRQLRKGMSQHQIGDALVQGLSLQDANGNKLKAPKLPATAVSIALDLEHPSRPGRISKINRRRAKRDLGIRPRKAWSRGRRRPTGGLGAPTKRIIGVANRLG